MADKGFYCGEEEDEAFFFSTGTSSALLTFQACSGMVETGVADEATWRALLGEEAADALFAGRGALTFCKLWLLCVSDEAPWRALPGEEEADALYAGRGASALLRVAMTLRICCVRCVRRTGSVQSEASCPRIHQLQSMVLVSVGAEVGAPAPAAVAASAEQQLGITDPGISPGGGPERATRGGQSSGPSMGYGDAFGGLFSGLRSMDSAGTGALGGQPASRHARHSASSNGCNGATSAHDKAPMYTMWPVLRNGDGNRAVHTLHVRSFIFALWACTQQKAASATA
jgi:hypothetical protein